MLSTAKTCSPAAGSSIYTREAALLPFFFPFQLIVSDTLSSLSSRFACSSSDVNHKFTPTSSSSYFTHVSSLAFGDSCGRAEDAARKPFMQIDVSVTSGEGAVIRAVGCSRAAFTFCLKMYYHDLGRVLSVKDKDVNNCDTSGKKTPKRYLTAYASCGVKKPWQQNLL